MRSSNHTIKCPCNQNWFQQYLGFKHSLTCYHYQRPDSVAKVGIELVKDVSSFLKQSLGKYVSSAMSLYIIY